MRRVIAGGVLILFGTLLGLAVAEMLLRASPWAPSRTNLRSLHTAHVDKPWLFGMRPGADVIGPGGKRYTVNSAGFRDREYAVPKPPDTFRIVLLGHSVAFGWAVDVEDSYPKALERRLAALAPGMSIEVLNLAVCGYNAYAEAALFADVGIRFQPDLVLVEFGVNDLNDPTMHFDAQTTRILGKIPDAAFPDPAHRLPPPPPRTLLASACEWSELCTLVARRFPEPLDAAQLRASVMPRDVHSAQELAWLRTQYDDMARTAARIGARFAVVLLPFSSQVEGRAPHQAQERVVAMGREAGWPVIDVLPQLQQATGVGDPLLDVWHPTPHGNAIVADAILGQLCCDALLPVPPQRCCGSRIATSEAAR